MNQIGARGKCVAQGFSCGDTSAPLWADLKFEQLDAGRAKLACQTRAPVAPRVQSRILGLLNLSAWWLGRQHKSSFAPSLNGAHPNFHDLIEAGHD